MITETSLHFKSNVKSASENDHSTFTLLRYDVYLFITYSTHIPTLLHYTNTILVLLVTIPALTGFTSGVRTPLGRTFSWFPQFLRAIGCDLSWDR